MPRTELTREFDSPPEKVWKTVGDPSRQARWWPDTERVDRPAADRFTRWVISPRGRAVAMSFTLEEVEPGARIRWRQDIEGTDFERAIRSSSEEIAIEESGSGSKVAITIDRRLSGTARLGGWLAARGQRRQLEKALDGLQRTLGG